MYKIEPCLVQNAPGAVLRWILGAVPEWFERRSGTVLNRAEFDCPGSRVDSAGRCGWNRWRTGRG